MAGGHGLTEEEKIKKIINVIKRIKKKGNMIR